MALLLICPHCQDRAPMSAKRCGRCGATLQALPPGCRRYFVGRTEEAAAQPPAPGLSLEPTTTEAAAVDLTESYPEGLMSPASFAQNKDLSLCEALDRILRKGAMIFGEVMLSVADIDLVYLSLQVILASVETARGLQPPREGQLGSNLFAPGDRR